MAESFDVDDLNILYSDDSDAYAVTVSSAKLGLMEGPTSGISPLYMDIDTGKAFYPDGVRPEDAEEIARYVVEETDTEISSFSTEKNEERWREEFSGLFDRDIETIETGSVELENSSPTRPYPY